MVRFSGGNSNELLSELKAKLASDPKISSIPQLDKIGKEVKFTYQNNADVAAQVNFLTLQLNEAADLVKAVPLSIKASMDILQQMRELASQAASGTYSSTDITHLDMKYQALKKALGYVQHINLVDGNKIVSGGDVTIRFGNEKNESSTLVIPIHAFDAKALDVEMSSIDSDIGASRAINLISSAMESLTFSAAVTNEGAISDILVMLKVIPYLLYQDYQLFDIAHSLILQGCNGSYSDADRRLIDVYFEQIKSSLNKLQVYPSLHGPKMLGGGNIYIQIGNNATPETTLKIELPTTDVKKLGMDKQNIRSLSAAYDSLSYMLSVKHKFIYGK